MTAITVKRMAQRSAAYFNEIFCWFSVHCCCSFICCFVATSSSSMPQRAVISAYGRSFRFERVLIPTFSARLLLFLRHLINWRHLITWRRPAGKQLPLSTNNYQQQYSIYNNQTSALQDGGVANDAELLLPHTHTYSYKYRRCCSWLVNWHFISQLIYRRKNYDIVEMLQWWFLSKRDIFSYV